MSDREWTFLHVNDSHMGTARSYRFRPAVNQRWAAIKRQMAAIDADLLLHGGDLTRDGETHEFEYLQAREDLDTLPFPSFVIPGNMDVGNKHATQNGRKRKWEDRGLGWHDPDLNMTEARLRLFSTYFGPIHWTFMHRDVRFTGFFAAVAGTGLPQEERLWRLLESLKKLPRAKHHVAVMHYWPFMESPDEPAWDLTNADEYDNWYFSIDPPHRQRLWDSLQAAGVEILFCGHVHTGRPVQLVDGIRVYRTQAAGNTGQLAERWPGADTRFGFHRCHVTALGIDVQFVPGDDQCEEFGTFGPLGHPPVDQRDYSVAQEQPLLKPDET
ncbi:MAG: metallophosphoesterase [Planctomycetaceae bacterium]|nr:metallophosphoesterase [Planctomycetales bacterium]MCB9872641.1 metallophosphoesterase [Planctomycetaceae bacterium]MCB9939533.1 metallophosphoesterase [Planctomycetaceae bacterium]